MQTQAEQPPRWGGIQAGPTLAGILYVLLVGSAALALWVREFPGFLPPSLEKASPWVFLAFIACFAAYRLALVRAGKYPAFKAFFQIAAATLFFMLLLPSARPPRAEARDDVMELLHNSDPRVRALAAETARHRPHAARYGEHLVRALRDSDEKVRAEAHRSLVAISGTDLGPPDDDSAVKAWGDRFR